MNIKKLHIIHELARVHLYYGGVKQKHLENRARQLETTPKNLMIAVNRYIKKHDGII